ncbi:MAG: hypothetical protein KAS21_10300, partial [Candidatus Aminicenantes bacterium]|nr:hypothetical protein [Candidatus Aminicenantes bacterium]
PGIDWRYIDTAKFRIVFPFEITEEGQRVANILEYIYPKISSGNTRGKRLTLFLPNSGIFSNGYIQLAPQKGEFFSTPPQSNFTGNTEWYSVLSLHEGKHVDQFDRLNSGFTRLGDIIFGDLGRSLLSFLSVPAWFWEGEAVNTETIYSSGGRGRLPSFSMSTRSIILAGKKFKYIKSYLSSYKDHIPDIYRLGYFITAYMANNLTKKKIDNILKISSDYSFYPLIFSSALKKKTGMNVKQLYDQVMKNLHSKWSISDSKLHITNFRKINTIPKRGWTLYTSAKVMETGDIISQKYGLSTPLSLVKISPDGNEKRITGFRPVSHINNNLSTSRDLIVWNEPVMDLRWGKRSYSEIVIFSISKNKKKRLTKRTRYFSPALSPNGKLIATIRFSKLRRSSLVILDSEDGKPVNEYNSPDSSLLLTPSWDQDGDKITLIRMKNGKQTIVIFDITNKTFTDILPLSDISYSVPVFFDDFIIYSSPYSGIDNIYAVEIKTGQQYRITGSRFGAFFPSILQDKKTLIYSDYNINGMDIVSIVMDQDEWIPLEKVLIDRIEYFKGENVPFVENDLTDTERIPEKKYQIKRYNPLKNLINFHSRVLLPYQTEPAIELYSSNKLNTAFITGGFSFNTNENTGKFYTKAVYAGLFPVIKIGFSRGGRNTGNPFNLTWNETTADMALLLPFNLSRGIFTRRLDIQAKFSSTKIFGSNENNGYRIEEGNINSISYNLRLFSYKHFSKRDLAPKLGQFFSAEFSHTPLDNYYKGERIFGHGVLYFPGIFRHNSLKIGLSYEKQSPVNYIFSSNVDFSRGYDYE